MITTLREMASRLWLSCLTRFLPRPTVGTDPEAEVQARARVARAAAFTLAGARAKGTLLAGSRQSSTSIYFSKYDNHIYDNHISLSYIIISHIIACISALSGLAGLVSNSGKC